MPKFWRRALFKVYKLFLTDIKHLFKVKVLWLYMALLLISSAGLSYLSDDPGKVLLSLLNISLVVVPLFSAFFSISYLYDSRSFIELLLSQPVGRGHIFWAKFLSVSAVVVGFFAVGIALPLIRPFWESELLGELFMFLISGSLLGLIFIAVAFLIGVAFEDRVKGISLLLVVWLYLSLLHDGLILLVIYLFRDYPLEKTVLVLSFLSPVDLARLVVVLNLDIGALMGVSGAVFKAFFGSSIGIVLSFCALMVWFFVPLLIALYLFGRRDF